ncbi:MAG: flagellar hook-associated protein FlgK [Planctomycetota bacterium]|nr:flagellar hook-associated protein FlgK [Planctomycetota bacterium]
MPDSLLIGLSALLAHRRAMEVTSHNLANAATEGYTRQRVDYQPPPPEEEVRPGPLGRGVDIGAVRRVADALIDERLRASASETSRLKTLRDHLKTIELVFNEPGGHGLSAVTDRLFQVFHDLSHNPEAAALRSAAVQELETWTSTINDLAQRLQGQIADANAAIASQVHGVNELTEQIARLNQQIRRQRLVGDQPNDLIDTRARLLGKLSEFLEIQVRHDPRDGSVLIDAAGTMLVGTESANPLRVVKDTQGRTAIVAPGGGLLRPEGGSLAALDSIARTIVPDMVARLDQLAMTIAKRLNALHATGTSQAMQATTFVAEFLVPSAHLHTDLDADALQRRESQASGFPPWLRPSFTDANGIAAVRNWTINVRNIRTGEARKYTVRYDPASGDGGRSLNDLVRAINTGQSGGFSVYPPDSVGIPGVRAKAVGVEGGWQLQLTTEGPYAIDFSPALDLRPHRQQWGGPQVTVSTVSPIPPQVPRRLQFEVEPVTPGSTQLQLRITTRSESDGASTTHGVIPLSTLPITVPVPGIGGSGQLTVSLAAGTYRAGDRFVVELNAAGQVLQKGTNLPGTYVQNTERPAADAGFAIRGRYTGSLTLTTSGQPQPPYTTWAMEVLSAGTIGVKQSDDPSDPQPPVVQFTYWTGAPEAPVQRTLSVVLDDRYPPGAPVPIADGVYAVFEAGTLSVTTPGNATRFTVDAEPDQAGLLTAFGFNGMLSGSDAASLRVADRLRRDPTQLNTALTRVSGDNANILRLIASRSEKLFAGTFTYDDTYNALLSELGVRIRQADRLSENQATIRSALEHQRQQISGVNIDEEVGMLILQQQAYSAAARVVAFARENIQTLLDIAR